MTKILAIQGSPRPKVSNTEVLLQEFLKGARSQGAETETVYLKEKKINYCIGCYTCWVKTPGVCVFKDDMPELLEKVRACDIIVFATPLYIYNMTPLLKAFQDRCLPLSDPHFIKVGNAHRHPARYEMKRSMVLISNCGFPEVEHFEGLRKVFRVIERNGFVPLVGEILMPAGEMLQQEALNGKMKKVLDAVFRAGVEVVRDGRVSREAEKIIQKPVLAPEEIIEMANIMWDGQIAADSLGTQGKEKQINDIKLMLRGMAALFNPEAIPGLRAEIQYKVTGGQVGNWYFSIAEGKCVFNEGMATNPTLTIKTPAEVWLAIANKEIDGQKAMIDGKYTVEGDMNLLMSVKNLFSQG